MWFEEEEISRVLRKDVIQNTCDLSKKAEVPTSSESTRSITRRSFHSLEERRGKVRLFSRRNRSWVVRRGLF